MDLLFARLVEIAQRIRPIAKLINSFPTSEDRLVPLEDRLVPLEDRLVPLRVATSLLPRFVRRDPAGNVGLLRRRAMYEYFIDGESINPKVMQSKRLSAYFRADVECRPESYEGRQGYILFSPLPLVSDSFAQLGSITPALHTTKNTLPKWKQGLSGFVNGRRISALPDTGSLRNVMSQAFAQEMNLKIKHSPSHFTLGNNKVIKSIGTVSVGWAFSESPTKPLKIVCDVIPTCSYPVILGSSFLTTTQTLSKYKHRLTECLFPISNVVQMNFLGGNRHRLSGEIGSDTEAFAFGAVLDTGAEGNVMNHSFALAHGLRIRKGPAYRKQLQFADGTYQETVGQVETYWAFESGERIPITFEILENCCSDVVLGDSIVYGHNVFEDHASSLVIIGSDSDAHPLAPFDFANKWQRSWSRIKKRFKSERNSGQGSTTTSASRSEEMRREARRQEDWDYQYSFGETASEAEKAAEAQKRANFKSRLRAPPQAPPESGPQQVNMYQVPSIPTAPNRSRTQRP